METMRDEIKKEIEQQQLSREFSMSMSTAARSRGSTRSSSLQISSREIDACNDDRTDRIEQKRLFEIWRKGMSLCFDGAERV